MSTTSVCRAASAAPSADPWRKSAWPYDIAVRPSRHPELARIGSVLAWASVAAAPFLFGGAIYFAFGGI
ncbi:putative methyl-accepting chemotaxis receptor/se nsory transducer with PAS domain [Mycolicibacterium canariasense]|uniref:Putative methyl-accepting chemotaxis receptor/se nsory transducer with PAS domain n=1 Tax=Mycolicibacterium canariasense TaxID=228230 RepID=A0A124E337_MYCCR|nr:hypothetical protein [Mycolicibacterium canariasense]MCV7208334.1 hypothetical protein [Mycolicibacterium canariasense]ORV13523.1 hypothetical protein AWB94_04680 [Mycolicibacterium canariasense]GAS98765.1 putative methyl-accepting chemotaxis receptor/se nsory transducer with PAS domain [Mycolicibacterium canariasense]